MSHALADAGARLRVAPLRARRGPDGADARVTSPLKLFNPRNAGTSAWAYLATEIANQLLATWTRAIAVNA